MATLNGTSNNDTINGTSDDDVINLFNGQDSATGGAGNDLIAAGGGDDTIVGGLGDDTILADQGQDSVDAGLGNDIIDGGDGDDRIFAGAGNDTITGGQGQDDLRGGLGDDSIVGGTGDDRLFGNEGDDTLVAGPNNDQLFGGQGSDVLRVVAGGEHRIDGGEDTDGLDEDILDLRGLDVNVFDNGDETGRVEFLDSNGNISGRAQFTGIERIVICFTPGTRLATIRGEVAVEQLQAGDKVFTRDNGIQTLAWTGARKLTSQDLAQNPEFNPILIRKSALGQGMPERDMLVSPNHRMLVTSNMADVLFGEREVLVAAKFLTGLEGVEQILTPSVTYIHLMFEHHEIVVANGAWTESFQPGEYALNGIETDQRCEIISLFPELDSALGLENYGAARMSLKKNEAHYLSQKLG